MFAAATVALLAARGALAHMELLYPPGINSKYDPQTPQKDIDYSMTNPLDATGGDYPCKHYNTPAKIASLHSVATLEQGHKFHVNLSGSATHNGGSCQFSLSYDGGKTFGVIASIVGGCPLAKQYDIDIPDGVPSMKKGLFAWTWQNNEGNREEYMNCAVVDIDGTEGASMQVPDVFRANTLPKGQCITTEGIDVMYPNPGKQVQYGGKLTASSPVTKLSPCSYNEDTTVTLSASGSSTGSSSGSQGAGQGGSNSTSSASSAVSKPSSSSAAASSPSSSSKAQPKPSSTPAGAGSGSGSGTGTGSAPAATVSAAKAGSYIQCYANGKEFYSCASGECIYMGAVAAGTKCVDGNMVAAAPGARRSERWVRRTVAHKPVAAHA